MNDFIGQFPLIVLSPQDLRLTNGTPQDRRRNFDLLISQVSRVYLDDLRNYSRVIRQKNSLLRDNLFNGRYSKAELVSLIEPWNEELADFGLKILLRRLDFIEEFKVYLHNCFSEIVGNRYVPVISYQSDIFSGSEESPKDVTSLRENFTARLKDRLELEIKRGISLLGPHRDNYVFEMEKDGRIFDIKTFASQGEHKTFVVSLKLSEFGYMKENLRYSNTGEPLLLLDDVFSELDKNRINKISSMITSYNQVFLTTTDYDYLKILRNSSSDINAYQITNGSANLVN
jgi:DNA replication and repair protein RecF